MRTACGVMPISCTASRPRGPETSRVLAQHRGRDAHPWHPAGGEREALVVAELRARVDLQPCRADDLVDQLAGGAGQALVGHEHAEDERDADRDAAAGEQLLDGMRAQPHAIEVGQHAQPYAGDARVELLSHDGTAAGAACGSPARRPSRSVWMRSTWFAASGSCVTSSPGMPRS